MEKPGENLKMVRNRLEIKKQGVKPFDLTPRFYLAGGQGFEP
jgi:hypothetical protein